MSADSIKGKTYKKQSDDSNSMKDNILNYLNISIYKQSNLNALFPILISLVIEMQHKEKIKMSTYLEMCLFF